MRLVAAFVAVRTCEGVRVLARTERSTAITVEKTSLQEYLDEKSLEFWIN